MSLHNQRGTLTAVTWPNSSLNNYTYLNKMSFDISVKQKHYLSPPVLNWGILLKKPLHFMWVSVAFHRWTKWIWAINGSRFIERLILWKSVAKFPFTFLSAGFHLSFLCLVLPSTLHRILCKLLHYFIEKLFSLSKFSLMVLKNWPQP